MLIVDLNVDSSLWYKKLGQEFDSTIKETVPFPLTNWEGAVMK